MLSAVYKDCKDQGLALLMFGLKTTSITNLETLSQMAISKMANDDDN